MLLGTNYTMAIFLGITISNTLLQTKSSNLPFPKLQNFLKKNKSHVRFAIFACCILFADITLSSLNPGDRKCFLPPFPNTIRM